MNAEILEKNGKDMAMNIRRSHERGTTQIGWLNSKHSFSFGNYYDPTNMGWKFLRVINDDIVSGEHGFGMHPHKNMEIVTLVLSGELSHKDSMGNSATLYPNMVQVMSAGSGVSHSEWNTAKTESAFLQIWITPRTQNTKPWYKDFTYELKRDVPLVLVGKNGLAQIDQNVNVIVVEGKYGANFKSAYVFVIEGSCSVNDETLGERDAAFGDNLVVTSDDAKLLIFEDLG
jgi:quercetin 2,3-dioxygenase